MACLMVGMLGCGGGPPILFFPSRGIEAAGLEESGPRMVGTLQAPRDTQAEVETGAASKICCKPLLLFVLSTWSRKRLPRDLHFLTAVRGKKSWYGGEWHLWSTIVFDNPFYHLIFSRYLRTMYCPIPKAACTSWKAYLRREMGLLPMPELELHSRTKNGFTYASEIEREELIRILFAKQGGFFKFTICRNPYDRLRAAYRDLVFGTEQKPPRGGRSVDNLRMIFCKAFDKRPSAVPFLTFDQFIRAIEASDPASLDRHWQLQSVLTCSNLLKYDAVVKYEEMRAQSQTLCERLGGKTPMDLHLNKSAATMELCFSPKMKEAVRRIYARDFAMFHYDAEKLS